jgi:hypothetical protein
MNRPNGTNVYQGVLKDYTKENVTPANFLKVLQGMPTNSGSRKVLERFNKVFIIENKDCKLIHRFLNQ